MIDTSLAGANPTAVWRELDADEPNLSGAERFGRLVSDEKLDFPLPGGGSTRLRFSMLRRVGACDLSLARLVEGHFDALAILAEADVAAPRGTFGVWAAGPVETLRAIPEGRRWRLEGTRRWCSGASELTQSLVRAVAPDGERLFLVPLNLEGICAVPGSWPAIGMADTSTLDMTFESVELPAGTEVGGPGFYPSRPGFWFGAAGVAAVWLGGAEAVASIVRERVGDDPHRLAHLGWITARLETLGILLSAVAEEIDSRDASPLAVERMVRVLRAEVVEAAASVIDRVGRATGADPLAHDRRHAQRVADLTLYLRQSHAETDLEQLGRLELRVLDGEGSQQP
jgi:alkylation response protein AidB-like acyl-CoA dehydrogenase